MDSSTHHGRVSLNTLVCHACWTGLSEVVQAPQHPYGWLWDLRCVESNKGLLSLRSQTVHEANQYLAGRLHGGEPCGMGV